MHLRLKIDLINHITQYHNSTEVGFLIAILKSLKKKFLKHWLILYVCLFILLPSMRKLRKCLSRELLIQFETYMFAIYWIGPVQYKPLVACIDLNHLKNKYGA